MKPDTLELFAKLQKSLITEKAELEDRLSRIDALLGQSLPGRGPERTAFSTDGRRRRRGPRSGISLRDAILKATSVKPLSKPEILIAVQKLGYRFSTDRPMGSINTTLYTAKHFTHKNGLFSPTKPK